MKKYIQIALIACVFPLVNYAYNQEYKFTFVPASGQVSSLGGGVLSGSGIRIYCDKGITYVGESSMCYTITIVDEEGTIRNTSLQFQGSTSNEFCTIQSLDNAITDSGIYTLKIPAGVAILDPDGLAEENEAMEVPYYIGDVEFLNLTTSVANDDEVIGPLASIIVSTENAGGLTLAKTADDDLTGITVVNDDTGDSYYCTGYTEGNDSYELTFNDAINTTGSYTLTIPALYFTGTSEESEDTTIKNWTTAVSFTLNEGVPATITLASPVATNAAVSEVELAADGFVELAADDVSTLTVACGEVSTTCEEVSVGEQNEDGTYPITLTLASELTDAGTYTVTIPEDFFYVMKAQAATNEELTLTFAIAAIEADPADGATITGVSEVTLTSNVPFELGTDDEGEAIITNTDMSDMYAGCTKCEISEDGLTCTLTFDEEVTDSPCMLYIPKGYFTFMDEDFTATYYIADITLAIDPADGTVTSLSEVTVTYDGGIALSEDSDVSDITLTSADGETVISATSCEAGEDNTQVVVTFEETIAPGEYTLNIPADIFTLTLDSETNSYAGNEETSVVYSLADLSLTFDPAGGTVESLTEITVVYENGIARNRSGNVSEITLTSEDGETVITATSCTADEESVNDNNDYTQFVITFTEPEESGKYTLYIPADFFSLTLDSDNFIYTNNEEVSVVYTLELPVPEGIDSVNASIFDDAEIYTISGQRVNTPVRGQVNIVRKSDGTVKKIFVK